MQLASLFPLALFLAVTVSTTYAVQYSDTYMVCLVNRARQSAGLSPVGLDSALTQAAQVHSDDMARMNSMDHTGSDGSSPGDRCERAGFQWTAVAENIAYGQNSMDEVMQVWMDSPGHRENILNPQYTMMGSAVSQGGGTPYYTQTFACDSGAARNIPTCDGDYPDMANASQGTPTQGSTGGRSRGGNNYVSTGGNYGSTAGFGGNGGAYGNMMGGGRGRNRPSLSFGGMRGGNRHGRGGTRGFGGNQGFEYGGQGFGNQGFGRNSMRGASFGGRNRGGMPGGMAYGGGNRGGFGGNRGGFY